MSSANSPALFLKQGDIGVPIDNQFKVTNSAGVVVARPIESGATINVRWQYVSPAGAPQTGTGTLVDDATGQVRFYFTGTDIDQVGVIHLEFVAVETNGNVTSPAVGYIIIVITDDKA